MLLNNFQLSFFLGLLLFFSSCIKPINKDVETQKFITYNLKKDSIKNIELIKFEMVKKLYYLIKMAKKKHENYEVLLDIEDIAVNYNYKSKCLFYKKEIKGLYCDRFFDFVYKDVEFQKLSEISTSKIDSNKINSNSLKFVLDSMFTVSGGDEANVLRGKYLNTNICNSKRIKNFTN